MGYGIEFLVAMIILLSGARNDLLDLIPTRAYWQAKKVTVSVQQLERDAAPDERIGAIDALVNDLAAPEFNTRRRAREQLAGMGPSILPQLQAAMTSKNPEVRAVAGEIARQFESKAKERTVRRLMAIRTLGERKEKEALPLLRTLEDSREMFVAEYARRAEGQIDGKGWEAPDRSASIRNDLQLLPRHAGIVGQTVGLSTTPMTLDTLFSYLDAAATQPHLFTDPNRDESVNHLTENLLPLVERIGNVRIDGLTMALSEDAGETTGWELTLIRGQFDAAALLAAARGLAHPADGLIKYGSEHGIPIVQTDVDTHIMFPSDQLMIIVMADEEKDRFARMLAMFYALQAGHGTITTDEGIKSLISKVNTNAPVWLVGTFNTEEKKNKLLAGINSFTLTGTKQGDALALTLHAEGGDAEPWKGSLDELNGDIQWLQQHLPVGMDRFAPIMEMVNSVHVASAGKEATITGTMKPAFPGAVMLNFLPLVDFKSAENPPHPQPAPNAPAQAIP